MTANEQPSETQIQELVEGLFVPERSADSLAQLQVAGNRALTFLIAALKDPRVLSTAFYPPVPPGLPNFAAPLYRISELLENSGSEDAAAPFIEYLASSEPRLREHGAWVLGSIALESCIAPVRQILAGPEQELRTRAMMGIERALDAGRGAEAFYNAICPNLADLLVAEGQVHFAPAPKLLARIDAQYAGTILQRADQLSLDNPQLRDVLAALNEAHSPIAHEFLLPLITQLEPLAQDYRRGAELSEGLLAYARNPDAHTEPKLKSLLQSPAEQVQTGAARALAALNGIEDPYNKLIEVESERGAEALSGPEKNYFAASLYYYEIQNGGPWQYFGNSTADYHRMILAGLRTIGASRTAQVLEDAGKLFGPDGPPENREHRDAVAESFTDEQFDQIEDAYSDFPGGENIEMLLFLYAADNYSEFRHCVGISN